MKALTLLIILLAASISYAQDFVPKITMAWDYDDAENAGVIAKSFYLAWGESSRGDVLVCDLADMPQPYEDMIYVPIDVRRFSFVFTRDQPLCFSMLTMGEVIETKAPIASEFSNEICIPPAVKNITVNYR